MFGLSMARGTRETQAHPAPFCATQDHLLASCDLGCRRRRMTHAACLSPSRVQSQQAASGRWLHGRPSRAPAPSFRRVTALFRLYPAHRLAPGTLCPAFPVNSGAGACLSEPHPGASHGHAGHRDPPLRVSIAWGFGSSIRSFLVPWGSVKPNAAAGRSRQGCRRIEAK